MATTASRKPARTAAKSATARKTATPRKATTRRPAPKTAAPAAKKATASNSKPANPGKVEHKAKHKLVRDSFTMPQQDFDLIGSLKKRALAAGRPAKKSELLRAGLQALARLDEAALLAALNALVVLKAGRPRKER